MRRPRSVVDPVYLPQHRTPLLPRDSHEMLCFHDKIDRRACQSCHGNTTSIDNVNLVLETQDLCESLSARGGGGSGVTTQWV